MTKIKQAMILAAGMGSRMLDLTQDIPKPMLVVSGISLIERHLQYLFQNDIKKVIINTYYKAETLEIFVNSLKIAKEMDIIFSREEELLGTAGGVKNALKYLGKDPFFIVNSDAIYQDEDSKNSAFKQMEQFWQEDKMPFVLLVVNKKKTFGFNGSGDFIIDEHNQLGIDLEKRNMVYIGMSITDYRIFENYPGDILQFSDIYKDLIAQNKLYGCVYQGSWLHIGDKRAFVEAPSI
jgi:MurNAc alpha-1-phosphate uridylyltransferase